MEQFEVIVVGAGLAGLACAYHLAQNGVGVLVVERGDYPGAKNVTGGRIYIQSLKTLLPDIWEGAPLERPVTRESLVFMNREAWVRLELASQRYRRHPHSYTVLRARFDGWLAERAEEAGAMVVPKMTVDDLRWEGGRVAGIVSGGDQVAAAVVVAADGASSTLARKAGLRGIPRPQDCAVGVKEVLSLPQRVIEDRFQLEDGEGAAMLMVGYPSQGLRGGGFLYTNRDTLSLGVVVGVREAMDSDHEVYRLTEELKDHPALSPLLREARLEEYSAHLLPEAGLRGIMPLCTHGLLLVGDAAGLCLNLGLTVRGMDYAVASGVMAAQAIEQAHQAGDFSANSLSVYESLLRDSFVLRDFRTFQRVGRFLNNPRLYRQYPEAACAALEEMLYLDGQPKESFVKTLRRELRKQVSWWELARDAWEVHQTL
ncbi:MAG: FAD-dependent oxidoreductase [Chloroflexi bacterium]|nr:FAD-dependent oxidoreductase [Chloroflexota bacterium]